MASMKFSLVLLLACYCTLSFQSVFADIICENLPSNVCAFAVSSSAKRCVLETSMEDDGRKVEYQCKTSEVVVGSDVAEYIETDECVEACGVDRETVGLSSDPLLDPTSMAELCSPECYNNCPNVVDLYFNLASGEGVYLPDLCQKRSGGGQLQSDGAAVDAAAADTPRRRAMAELSSDAVAPATQQRYSPRRAMVERVEAPAPISGDDDTL